MLTLCCCAMLPGFPWRLGQVRTQWFFPLSDDGSLILDFSWLANSALCIGESHLTSTDLALTDPSDRRADYHWDDPRSEQEKTSSKMSAALGTPNPEHKSLEDLADSIDISYTSAPDGFELKFDSREVLEVMPWGDDPRLRDFEAAFFDEGGIVNGQGF